MKYYVVYNAKSGFFNKLSDAAHKAISPSTYQCDLCSLTYGLTSMKTEWKAFITKYDMEFTYKDVLAVSDVPAVYDDNKQLIISSEQISACQDLTQLKQLFSKHLKTKYL